MNKNFLLTSKKARQIYNKYAKLLPIVDYHNHLSISDIISNKRYTDIYELWIKPDPYKHRAMRICGVNENLITGNASNLEKFKAWCEVFPSLVGNPLYGWTMMELKAIFNMDIIPNKDNYLTLYNKANDYLSKVEITPSYLIDLFRVCSLCPCASLDDDITVFKNNKVVSPSLRGDNIVLPTLDFILSLSKNEKSISNINDYLEVIDKKLLSFYECGCRFSDHALDDGFTYSSNFEKIDDIFSKILDKKSLSENEQQVFSSFMLKTLLGKYEKVGMTVQLHIGAKRKTSDRLCSLAGKAGGFAGIGNSVNINSLTTLLNDVEKEFALPKIILFTLNPSDNAMLSILSGSYSKDNVNGLITQGPAWWWCDHKFGIEGVLDTISNYSVLSEFVGMTTDSRSFLSLVRHDYFRRVLCSYIADKIKKGEFPSDNKSIENLVYRLCYGNANKILSR